MSSARRFVPAYLLIAWLAACSGAGPTDPKMETPSLAEAVAPRPDADLIVFVAKVHPLDGDHPPGEAIAIKGSRILAISTAVGVLRYRGPRTALVRFPGAHAFPGLQDAHAHVLSLGAVGIELRDATSYAQVVERVAASAARQPKGTWILGRGWDQNLWAKKTMPDHRALSRVVPDHPVWLARVDGHAGLANARAMELAGIDTKTEDPAGGRLLRSEDGTPKGILVDAAMELIASQVPEADAARLEMQLLTAQVRCLRAGLTRVHDAGVSPRVRDLLRRLEREGKWKLGIYGMVDAPRAALPPPDDSGPRARVRYRAAKMLADGALGSRGAALLAPYSDDPGNRGLMTTEPEALRAQIDRCREAGYQPCVHAIGDRANRVVLDAYATILNPEERAALRPRLEHAQILAPEDLGRLVSLGVVASMQPTHLTSDMPWVPDRVGPDRVNGSYAFKTLLDRGTRLCFGSDFPVEPESPFEGIFAAVTTRSPRDPAGPPLRPDQILSRRQALEAFTVGAAWAAFEEEVRGRLAPGYEADLTIVDRDLLAVPSRALLGTKVLATMIGGEIVYEIDDQR